MYFATPYPLVRVRADATSLKTLDRYEAFTPLKAGSKIDDRALDRDSEGALRYGWKTETPFLGAQVQNNLVASGKLKREECLLGLVDAETGTPVIAHGGSVYWNAYRGRWVMIVLQQFGTTSMLGEEF